MPVPSTIVLDSSMEEQNVVPSLRWFHDKNKAFRLNTLDNVPESEWQLVPKDIINLGMVEGQAWFVGRIDNPQNKQVERLFHVHTSNIGDITLLLIKDGEVKYLRSTGYKEPVIHRPMHHREFVFPLSFEPHTEYQVVMRVESHNPIQLPITLWHPKAFYAADAWNVFYWGAFFGLMAVMVLYNAFLGVATRVPMYGYYVGFATCICASQLFIHGIPTQFFSKGGLIQPSSWLPLSIFGAIIGASLFSNQFFRLRRGEDWRFWLNIVNASLAGLGVLLLIILPYQWSLMFAGMLVMAASVAALVIGVTKWRATGLPALYFTTAWGTLVFGSIVLLLSRFGYLPRNGLTEHAMRFGAVMDVTLLSLALASQINQEKKQRIIAQEQALSYEREAREAQYKALELERKSALELEKLVNERTADLNRALAKLDKSDKAKNKFLAAISHDLRQPMQAIHLMVASLRKRKSSDDRLLEPLQQSVEQLSQMFTGLLDYTSLESGHVKPQLVDIDILSLLNDVVTEQRDHIFQARQEVKVRGKSTYIHSDSVLLGRILRNLVVNVQRHAGPCRMIAAVRRYQQHCVLEIIDNGIGIPEDKLDKIFEDYFRVNNESRHSETGLGLGLGIVKRLSTYLNIELKIRSVEGQGTRFTLTIPYGSEPAEKAESNSSLLSASGERIAIIDDDKSITTALVEFLAEHGYLVRSFNTIEDFFFHLIHQHWQPQLLICDINLGGQRNFFDLLEGYKKRQLPQVPILAISGETDPAVQERLAAEDIPLLRKPVKPAKLLMAINHILL
jgi:signal transduction histidine kinase